MQFLELARYELYKLWSFGYVRFLFILLLAVNMISASVYCSEFLDIETRNSEYSYTREDVFYVHQLRENDPEWFEAEYEHIDVTWSESFDSEPPMSIYSKCDWRTFEHVYRDVHAYENYVSDIEKTIHDAKYLLHIAELYENEALSATKEYQEHVIETYSKLLEEVKPYSSHAYGWRAYFSFSTVSVIMFLWVLITSVTLYHEHITTGFAPLGRICKNGRLYTAVAKLIVMILIIVVSVMVFLLLAMLVIELQIGFTGGEAPIQLLEVHTAEPDETSYTYVPLALSMRGYALANAGLKCIVLSAFATFVVLVTSFTNNIIGYISGILLFVCQYYAANAPVITTNQWRNLNLITMCRDNVFLTRLREVVLFGTSTDLYTIAIVSLLTVTVVFSCLTALRFSAKRAVSKQSGGIKRFIINVSETVKRAANTQTNRRYPTKLWVYEIRKSRITFAVWVILIIIMWYITSEYYRPPNTAYDRMYSEIMKTYEGEYTEEKADAIIAQRDEYQAIVDEFSVYEAAFQKGEISEKKFFNLYEKYLVAQGRLPVYRDLALQSMHIAKTPGGWYFYDTGVLEYANRDNDWGALLFVLLLGAGIFLPEYKKKSSESTTISIIRTAKHGRRRFVSTKLWLVTISAVTASVIANAVEICCYLKNYDTSAISAPMRSVAEYAEMPSWLSVGGYFALTMLLSIVGTVILALIACAISCIGERAVTVYAVVTVLLLPYASVLLGMDFMTFADLTRLSDAQRLLTLTNGGGLMPTAIYYAVATVGAALAVRAVYAKTERKA